MIHKTRQVPMQNSLHMLSLEWEQAVVFAYAFGFPQATRLDSTELLHCALLNLTLEVPQLAVHQARSFRPCQHASHV